MTFPTDQFCYEIKWIMQFGIAIELFRWNFMTKTVSKKWQVFKFKNMIFSTDQFGYEFTNIINENV